MLPKKALTKFFDNYIAYFKEELPEAALVKKAEALIALYTAVYGQPLDNYKKNNSLDNEQ